MTTEKKPRKPKNSMSVTDILRLQKVYNKVAMLSLNHGRNKTRQEIAKAAYDEALPHFNQDVTAQVNNPKSAIFQIQEAFCAAQGTPWIELKELVPATLDSLAVDAANNCHLLMTLLEEMTHMRLLVESSEEKLNFISRKLANVIELHGDDEDGDEDDEESDEDEDEGEDDDEDDGDDVDFTLPKPKPKPRAKAKRTYKPRTKK